MELTLELPIAAAEAKTLCRYVPSGAQADDLIHSISEHLRGLSEDYSACLAVGDIALASVDGITVYHRLDASVWGDLTPEKRALVMLACGGKVGELLVERARRNAADGKAKTAA